LTCLPEEMGIERAIAGAGNGRARTITEARASANTGFFRSLPIHQNMIFPLFLTTAQGLLFLHQHAAVRKRGARPLRLDAAAVPEHQ
jgi:hypothetical protein